MHDRRAVLQCRPGIDDRRKRLVLDHDQLRRVLRGAAARRRDHGNGVTGIARLVDRNRLVLRRIRILGRKPRAGQRALPLLGDLRTGPGADDVCMRERGRHVHLHDARVRIRAAHNAEVHHPGDAHVVHPLRLSLKQLLVLFTLDRDADRPADLDLHRRGHRATAEIASTMF